MAYEKLSLNGKVAVVVGGTTGIGNALSLGLTEAGASVVASSRRIEEVERTAKEIEQRGGRTLRQTSDVTDRASLEKLKDAVLARFEKVDILINCAGRTKRTPTLDVSEEEWNAIIECNLTGTLRGCQIFGRHMLERGYGRIVNIASLTTFVGFKDVAAYGASKAAVGSLTKTLAVEWGPRGVNVNGIAPGVFVTDLNRQLLEGSERGKELKLRTPGGRFGHVEELVGAAIFLSSDAAGFVNGEIIAVDGGFLASGVNQ
jgi:NAD(P)-dependent dehydrogenase (short-subunit alcohol dehydrogenase family)